MPTYNRWGFENPERDPNAGDEVTLTGTIERQTEMAILFKFKKLKAWLPKSIIAVVQDVNGVRVTMPWRLARQKQLV